MIGYKINDSFGQIGSGTTPKSNDDSYYADNGIPWLNSGDLTNKEVKFIKKKITDKALSEVFSGNVYHEKSLAIAMYGATIGKTGIVNGGFVSNQACCILSKPLGVNLNYVQYVINSSLDKLLLESQGGGQQNINQDIIKNFRFFAPEKSEQEDIARYLDKKIVLIDNKIDHLTQKLHHLEEYKTALIHNAVTKGLDANGNSLIGDDFISCRMKDLFFESNERSKSGDEVLLSLSKYHGIRPRNLVTEKEERAESLVGYKIVKKGDLVINKMLAWDKAIAYSDFDGIVSPDYSVYRHKANNKTQTIFCVNALKDNILQEKIRGLSKGIIDSRLRLNAPQFFSLSINMPSVNGIDRINKYCIDKISLVDEACHFTNKKIALLLEYKKSLINEAVSGQ
ncbi:hypothetical protein HJ167_20475 [Vibrio parahaemolyticus]|nr:hypothetical protein [Vibrio parahaemolyticus]